MFPSNLETEDAKLKQLQVLQRYNVNMNDLYEYRRNKPLVETIKSQQKKLEKAEGQINYLKKEFCNEQLKNFKYSRLISEYELTEANKLLDRPIELVNYEKYLMRFTITLANILIS